MNSEKSIAGAMQNQSGDEIEEIVKRSGSSFYWAMRRLPDEKRRAMYAIYAFCR